MPLTSPPQPCDAVTVAANLRRHLAREGLTFDDVIAATGLDDRTIRGLVRATKNPHARTLHKLASGLGMEMDDLFRPRGQYAPRQFDRATNTLVKDVLASRADVFANWAEADFDELYSRFGTGGQLTEEGIVAAAEAMNAKREAWHRASIVLESSEAELLVNFINLLYQRVTEPPKVAGTLRVP